MWIRKYRKVKDFSLTKANTNSNESTNSKASIKVERQM